MEQITRSTTYAKDALGANQLDQLVLGAANGIALSIGLEVTQVTDVAVGVGGSTVALAEGVDWKTYQPLNL